MHPRAGVGLCSPPRPRADRAALDSADIYDRTGAKRRRTGTYPPSPLFPHPLMLYTAACWSATHDRADAYSLSSCRGGLRRRIPPLLPSTTFRSCRLRGHK